MCQLKPSPRWSIRDLDHVSHSSVISVWFMGRRKCAAFAAWFFNLQQYSRVYLVSDSDYAELCPFGEVSMSVEKIVRDTS